MIPFAVQDVHTLHRTDDGPCAAREHSNAALHSGASAAAAHAHSLVALSLNPQITACQALRCCTKGEWSKEAGKHNNQSIGSIPHSLVSYMLQVISMDSVASQVSVVRPCGSAKTKPHLANEATTSSENTELMI